MLVEFSLRDDYWSTFELSEHDIEFLNNHLLEIETPLSPGQLVKKLVPYRLSRERDLAEKEIEKDGEVYFPMNRYNVGEILVFPALERKTGRVTKIRTGKGILGELFDVAEIEFGDDEIKEFAVGLSEHTLNNPQIPKSDDPSVNPVSVLEDYGDHLENIVAIALANNSDFVYIAGRWFPKSLIIDVNVGNLNLAEAVLDMHEGGPLATIDLLDHVGLPEGVNPHLAEFSLDLSLQDDDKFDEVGPEGEVAWFLKKKEPKEALNPPIFLQYHPIEYDRSTLSDEMLSLEKLVDDELSPGEGDSLKLEEIEIRLIFPHWHVGTLPLSHRMRKFFPTAYEAPRIRFMLVDGKTGEKFPGWVVRLERYVYGLSDWYKSKGLMPGSYVNVRHGEQQGEVIVDSDSHRTNKEWVRTALVGADGGVVYAMLKQAVSAKFDERMMIYMSDEVTSLEEKWKENGQRKFEEIVARNMRELAKLNPQNHVHVTELYSAVNVELRSPPGPIMNLLATRSWFKHVGDLHYRIEDED